MTTELRTILLAEDNANDVELTFAALRGQRLANEIVVVRDGAEALDYLHRRGQFAGRAEGNPGLMLLDLKMPKVDGLEVLSATATASSRGTRGLVARRCRPGSPRQPARR